MAPPTPAPRRYFPRGPRRDADFASACADA
jgi:hypothetical protein